jgi:small subunit ribosomal protein S6
MREYEFVYITRSDLQEKDRKDLAKKYEDAMIVGGGQFLKKDEWGVKKLAYPINKQFQGHYTFYDFVAPRENIAEVERLMRIDDKILRFMSVKIGEKVDIEARKVEIATTPKYIPPAESSGNFYEDRGGRDRGDRDRGDRDNGYRN